jgi:branched-chain amino acid transport system ATP-binding protein
MADAPLLDARSLSKSYGGIRAVTDVSIQLVAGEVLCLVGPNGAGKTTLVDLLTGVQSSDSGSLSLQGARLRGRPARRAQAGLARTFQHPQLALTLTVRENILLGRMAKEMSGLGSMLATLVRSVVRVITPADADIVDELAADLGIDGLDRLCADLTLGEQRLVEVARALAQDPAILLLDEPFAGSDAHGVHAVSQAIRNVAGRGHGVVLVDHNVDIVASLADRIVLMDQGRVVFDGDPTECLQSEEMQMVYFGEALV